MVTRFQNPVLHEAHFIHQQHSDEKACGDYPVAIHRMPFDAPNPGRAAKL
jgi:hypothetical protein